MLKNMDKYCSYCSSKIFESDRTCLQCGAPTKDFIFRNIDSIKYDNRTYVESKLQELKVNGWSDTSAIVLAQKISAWNGGKTVTIICDSTVLFQILPVDTCYRYNLTKIKNNNFECDYLGYKITTDQRLLEQVKFVAGEGSRESVYFVCLDSHSRVIHNIVGIINA